MSNFINSRAAGLITTDTYTNNRNKHNKHNRHNFKKRGVTQNKNKIKSNEINVNINSEQEFPDLITNKTQTKLEKKMNYVGVVAHEVITNKVDPVKDGWVKIKKDKSGFVSKTYGKGNNSLQVQQDTENRNINEIFRNIVKRYNNYKIMDQETYFTNYKYSWESDSDNESMSDGFSDVDNYEFDYYDDDEEFNADY